MLILMKFLHSFLAVCLNCLQRLDIPGQRKVHRVLWEVQICKSTQLTGEDGSYKVPFYKTFESWKTTDSSLNTKLNTSV